MANTVIQIKRSTGTLVPTDTSLAAAEPAYSYLSDKLFLGSSDGSTTIAVGGKYFVDQQNTILTIANLAYDAANSASANGMNYAYVNTATQAANSWANGVGTAANSYTNLVGAASNGWANTVVAGANGWTNTVFGYSNTYTDTVGAASNGWANTVGTAANSYAVVIGASSNGWANTVGSAANSYADAVGVAANTYANNTFLKLTGGTINGDLNVSGNLTITGNTSFINVSTFKVDDPLLYLAGNNYTSDIVDIGFVANYVNSTGSNVHTGFFRDAGSKEYYVFEGYDEEPHNNVIDPNGNNFTISVLNATLKSSNIILNGANLWSWVNNAYTRANVAPDIANSYTITVGAAANGWANTVVAGANGWTNTVFGYSNTHTDTVGAAANGWANTVGTAANSYAVVVGAAANGWANTVGTAANSYADGVGTAANTNAANASYLSTGTVPSDRISGSYSGITGVGTIASGTWNGSTITVPYGGTGKTSFTANGILYGNTAGDLKVTAAGMDGQVLQSDQGIPKFAMLDGGVF
jgi:hypothetical protein